MPIRVDPQLPAAQKLARENIQNMEGEVSAEQKKLSLRLLILNLMPLKETTEEHLLRLVGNTPLEVEVVFLRTKSYQSKNTSAAHLAEFYLTLEEVRDEKFDAMIVTGAPVEHLAFEEVAYWPELVEIMEWSKSHVYSTFYICWGAQAGLYYFYGLDKYPLSEKLFGIFEHSVSDSKASLLKGMDDVFYLPHSRHTGIHKESIEKTAELEILAESNEAGVALIRSRDNRQVFITGHAEYDANTLEKEYMRDLAKGRSIAVPQNYYPNDAPSKSPIVRWRSAAHLLVSNWLNYIVYNGSTYKAEQSIGKP